METSYTNTLIWQDRDVRDRLSFRCILDVELAQVEKNEGQTPLLAIGVNLPFEQV